MRTAWGKIDTWNFHLHENYSCAPPKVVQAKTLGNTLCKNMVSLLCVFVGGDIDSNCFWQNISNTWYRSVAYLLNMLLRKNNILFCWSLSFDLLLFEVELLWRSNCWSSLTTFLRLPSCQHPSELWHWSWNRDRLWAYPVTRKVPG